MSEAVIASVFDKMFGSGRLGDHLAVVWALGEPLSLPISFYRRALDIARAAKPSGLTMRHGFQTNATLVTDEWCEFIRANDLAVGVSLDGPKRLHDARRRSRAGRGTFDQAIDGVRRLQAHGVEVTAICVVSEPSLTEAQAIVRQFEQLGIRRFGLNVEEIDGANVRSTLDQCGAETRVRAFFTEAFRLFEASETLVQLREYDASLVDLFATRTPKESVRKLMLHQVAVDWRGNMALFSPELLNMSHADYGDFHLGNLCEQSVAEILAGPKFQRMAREVQAGVEQCWATCNYFQVCGGGNPSNKMFENGSFASTETLHCRLTRQAVMDALLAVRADAAGHPARAADGVAG